VLRPGRLSVIAAGKPRDISRRRLSPARNTVFAAADAATVVELHRDAGFGYIEPSDDSEDDSHASRRKPWTEAALFDRHRAAVNLVGWVERSIPINRISRRMMGLAKGSTILRNYSIVIGLLASSFGATEIQGGGRKRWIA